MIRPFCIMLLYQYLLHYGLLLHIMSQYLCLFSLILQGLHKEGECRQLEFWAGKGANIRDLFCTTPKVLKLHGCHFWKSKKMLSEENTIGGPHPGHEGGRRALPPWARPCLVGPLAGLRCPSSAIWRLFTLEKIVGKLTGRNSAATRRNLGGTNLGLQQSCSAGDTSLREGEIITIVITNAPLIGRGQSPSTSSPAPSPLKP